MSVMNGLFCSVPWPLSWGQGSLSNPCWSQSRKYLANSSWLLWLSLIWINAAWLGANRTTQLAYSQVRAVSTCL